MNDCESANHGNAEFAVENDECISLDDIRTNDLRNVFTTDLNTSNLDSTQEARASSNDMKQIKSTEKELSSFVHVTSDEDNDDGNMTDASDGIDKTDKLKTHITSIIEGILDDAETTSSTVLGTVSQVTKRRDPAQGIWNPMAALNKPSTSHSFGVGLSRQSLTTQDFGTKFESITSVKVILKRLDPALIALYCSPEKKKRSSSICSIASSRGNVAESDNDDSDAEPRSRKTKLKSHKVDIKQKESSGNKSSKLPTAKPTAFKAKLSTGNNKKKAAASKKTTTKNVILSSEDEIEHYHGGFFHGSRSDNETGSSKKTGKKLSLSADSDGENGKKSAKTDLVVSNPSPVKKTAHEQRLAEANDKRFDLILASTLIGNASKSKPMPASLESSTSFTKWTTLSSPATNSSSIAPEPRSNGVTNDHNTASTFAPTAMNESGITSQAKQAQKTVEIEWDSETECINIVIRRKRGSSSINEDARENCISIKKKQPQASTGGSSSNTLPPTSLHDNDTAVDLVTIDDNDDSDNESSGDDADVPPHGGNGRQGNSSGKKRSTSHSASKKPKKKKSKS